MSVSNIPDDHHVVRYCRFKLYFEENGHVTPYPELFHLKPASAEYPAEDYLSGVYYEWCDGTPQEKMAACSQFILVKMKPKDVLLRMNAGLIRQQGIAASKRLRVTHEPEDDCPPYAAVRGLAPEPDNNLCQLLATLSVVEAIARGAIQLA